MYAVPDSMVGIACIDANQLGAWYRDRWPVLQEGLSRDEAEELFRRYKPIWPRTDD